MNKNKTNKDFDLSKSLYNDIIHKFLNGEFTEEDFQMIFGPSMGSHFYPRYNTEDPIDGIKELFRQFTADNSTLLYNVFQIFRDKPGITSYQVLVKAEDESQRMVVLYDATGNWQRVKHFAPHRVAEEIVRSMGYKPALLGGLPTMRLPEEEFNTWEQ